jgi:hypothetical protein
MKIGATAVFVSVLTVAGLAYATQRRRSRHHRLHFLLKRLR